MKYTGRLSPREALHGFLVDGVLRDVLGFGRHDSRFEVYQLDRRSSVFLYADCATYVKLVGKFFGPKWREGNQLRQIPSAETWMRREYNNLQIIRNLGFDMYPHRTVKPLAMNENFDCLLVEEFAPGVDLNAFIYDAVHSRGDEQLYVRLNDLAWLLANLHNRSQTAEILDCDEPLLHCDIIVEQLARDRIISDAQVRSFSALGQQWALSGILDADSKVLIHGDVTPTQFICRDEHEMTVIDLESARLGDRAADLGRMAAELKHVFFYETGDLWSSERYIEHFYQSYASYVEDSVQSLSELQDRARFYMGCDELRICRNPWVNLEYRRELVREAQRCLNR